MYLNLFLNYISELNKTHALKYAVKHAVNPTKREGNTTNEAHLISLIIRTSIY